MKRCGKLSNFEDIVEDVKNNKFAVSKYQKCISNTKPSQVEGRNKTFRLKLGKSTIQAAKHYFTVLCSSYATLLQQMYDATLHGCAESAAPHLYFSASCWRARTRPPLQLHYLQYKDVKICQPSRIRAYRRAISTRTTHSMMRHL